MNKINAQIIRNRQIAAQKAALIARLCTLFAQGGAHVEPLSALLEVKRAGKRFGHHHVDCALTTSDQKTYYFCFGYNRVKQAEHPFFILLKDNWFDGAKLIAQDGWFYESLSEVMNIQGGFLGQGITVAISNVQVDQAA
jgi:hypothetical protein